MPHYSLVASGRSDVQVADIVLSRNEDTGEPDIVLAVGQHVEISDEDLLTKARSLAERLGYRVIEVQNPDEAESEETQNQDLQANPQVGVDTVAAAPEVSDQPGESPSAPAQGSDAVDAGTTQGGNPSTSATTTAFPRQN